MRPHWTLRYPLVALVLGAVIVLVATLLPLAIPAASADAASFPTGDPPLYHAVDVMHVPGWSQQQCFDLAVTDAHRLYLADATARAIDVFDTTNHRFLFHLGQGLFTGDGGCAQGQYSTLGPEGLLAIGTEIWAGNGNSSVNVFDVAHTPRLIATINTGGKARADEMTLDAKDGVLIVTNPDETTPFLSFISTKTHRILKQLFFPRAIAGLEQPVWDAATSSLYLSVPEATFPARETVLDPSGALARIRFQLHANQIAIQAIDYTKISDCTPAGLALDGSVLAVGCAVGDQALLTTSGTILARIKGSGVDAVAVMSHHIFFAGDSLIITDLHGHLLQRLPTPPGSHAVAVDQTGQVFVPESGIGVMVYTTGRNVQ